MIPSGHMAFTCRYNGRSLRLTSEVTIFPPHGPTSGPLPQGEKYHALYDTGATHSAISPRVVADLKLPSIGATNVGVGGGTLTTSSHLVNIGLPNKVMFSTLRVAQMALHGGIDVLIGMDVIGSGDFSVTHHNGKTTFSFCCPSRKEIDFVTEIKDGNKATPAVSTKTAGRNDPCPCGSGKKYKKCHGA
jgi:hypothetical protein